MLKKVLGLSLLEGFVDNCFRDTVKPELGSVLYCDLLFGIAVHSGIYVGNNEIVHLDGSGRIELVSPDQFLNRLNGFNIAVSIYVSSYESEAIGNEKFAERALAMLGKKRAYNLLLDNCHQFTAGCISGDFENHVNYLWMLKNHCIKYSDCNTWRVWER